MRGKQKKEGDTRNRNDCNAEKEGKKKISFSCSDLQFGLIQQGNTDSPA